MGRLRAQAHRKWRTRTCNIARCNVASLHLQLESCNVETLTFVNPAVRGNKSEGNMAQKPGKNKENAVMFTAPEGKKLRTLTGFCFELQICNSSLRVHVHSDVSVEKGSGSVSRKNGQHFPLHRREKRGPTCARRTVLERLGSLEVSS